MLSGTISRLHAFTSKRIRRENLAKEIPPLIKGSSRILDLGCGDGLLGEAIADNVKGAHLFRCDITRKYEGAPHAFVLCDGANLPYKDGCFDCVLLSDVLHHSRTPATILKEALRVASDRIIIKDHTRRGFVSNIILHLMDFYGNTRTGNYGVKYMSAPEWLRFFSEVGGIGSVKSMNPEIYGPYSIIFPRGTQTIHVILKK
jgi:SAM-dependent methyltransferase